MQRLCGRVELGHTLGFDDYTVVLRVHLLWRDIDIGTGLFLIGGVADGPKRCGRQDPPPKAAKELPQLPDTAVVGWSAINKGEGVETTLGEAGNRTAKTSKEGTPYARDLELMAMADEFFAACYDSIGAIEEIYL